MQERISKHKDNSFLEEDPLPSLLKQICIVKTPDISFAARMISIQGEEVWFENKRGQKWMVNRQNILEVKPVGERRST